MPSTHRLSATPVALAIKPPLNYKDRLGFQIRGIGRAILSCLSFKFQINGSHRFKTFFDVYERYCELHLPTVTESTRIKFLGRADKFFQPLFPEPIGTITPEKIAKYLTALKANYKPSQFATRQNFQKELKDLKQVFGWWSDQYDFRFKNPVRKFHQALSVIAELPEKDRKISVEQMLKFLSCLEEGGLYHDIATIQFYCAGRIGEIAGIQIKNIDLDKRVLLIKEVLTWINGVPRIKNVPKNGKPRQVYINDTMAGIFKRRIAEAKNGCPFLFHDQGLALRFNRLNFAMNQAWKKAGLYPRFSGSHILRYGSAQCARLLTGSLDAAAAVTGHMSMAMAAKYGKLDSIALNQSSVTQIEEFLKSSRSKSLA